MVGEKAGGRGGEVLVVKKERGEEEEGGRGAAVLNRIDADNLEVRPFNLFKIKISF